MVLLTFIIGLIAVKVRFKSVKGGLVSPKYFKLMNGEQEPEMVTITTRCFNNQFEIPVLFYVVCTLYITLGVESVAGLMFAWLFVVFRVVHAYIHLTYNHIIHRMSAFWLAFISVMAMWLILIGQQL
jgi:hypothetical protein